MPNHSMTLQEQNQRGVRSAASDYSEGTGYGSYRTSIAANDDDFAMIDIWNILNILKKWWWIIAVSAGLITALTALFVFRMTPVYMASSILEIKQQERQIFNTSEVENFIVDKEFFQTQVELLKSTTLAESIIDSLGLMSDPDFAIEGAPGQVTLGREIQKRRTVQLFANKLGITPIGKSRLIKVSFEHTNPKTAARITNAVTDRFISYNMERKYNATSYARDFIEERLKSTKEILENSERDLVKYATDNDLVTVGSGQGGASPGYLDSAALISLNAELTAARTKRVETEQRYNLALTGYVPEVKESGAMTALKTQYIELKSEYMEKLAIYKPQFPEMVELQGRLNYLDTQIQAETQKSSEQSTNTILSDLKSQYQVALAGEKNLEERVNVLKSSVVDIRDKSVDYNILKREVDTNRTQYDALLQRMKEVSISDEVGSNLISLVDRAKAPIRPFKPNKLRSLILGFLIGSILGAGIVFFIDLIDDRIKTPDDVKKKLKSTVMAVIPKVRNGKNVSALLGDSQSGIAEAYASLRTNLQFSGPDGGPRIIHLTSTKSGEGKSVSALGLALRFAGLNEKVLLIDADLRLPTFMTEEGESIGLSGLLTSSENPGDHIQHTKFTNLDLLPAGNAVPNPSEILSTYRLGEIFDYVREHYDHVIVDSPPVMGLADAPVLAAKCDASLLIVECASIRTPAIKSTMERLMASGAKLLGVVMTKYNANSKGYLNYYQYSYGDSASQYGSSKGGKKSKAALNKQHINVL